MLTSFQLRSRIKSDLPNAHVQISDANYLSPNFNWIKNELYSHFFVWLQQNGLNHWRSSWDCDRFAFAFYLFCNICHARTMNRQNQNVQGISVGILYYTVESSGAEQAGVGHAINFIENNRRIHYLEPQNGSELNLTQSEKESAWWAVC